MGDIMAEFSPVKTALTGFTILKEKPAAVAVWAGLAVAFYVVFVVLMIAVMGAGAIGALVSAGAGGTPDLGAMGGGIAFALLLMLLFIPASMYVSSVIYCAVNRAVLRPDDGGSFYVRFGPDEFRVFLLLLIFVALYIGFVIVCSIVIGILGMLGGIGRFIGTLAYLAALIYLATRMSLAVPQTFATGKLNVFGTWELTKGRFWPILGSYALMAVIAVGIAIVFIIVMSILMAVLGMGSMMSAAGGGTPDVAAMLGGMGVGMILMIVLYLVLLGILIPITYSPPAAIYRDISGSATTEVF